MTRVVVIGAGITGITTAYFLLGQGYDVTVVDRHFYPAMETSFANGGQLSASNSEVWNSVSTVMKGLKWVLRKDAPLLLNPSPSWHKYSWLSEFVAAIRSYRANTIETTRLAIEARRYLFAIAEAESIQFDVEHKGILHFYHDRTAYEAAGKSNALLRHGGLERYPVSPQEIREIEPALRGTHVGGYYTPSDATGDIHKFTRGLAEASVRKGLSMLHGVQVVGIKATANSVTLQLNPADTRLRSASDSINVTADILVVCGGVGSRQLASMVGDRVNVYPVKGYSITVHLDSQKCVSSAPRVSLLDERAKIVTSRLGDDRFRVAGTAELNGYNRDIRDARIQPLVRWVRDNFDIETSRVTPWAGLRPMMPDMIPRVFRGKSGRVFYNTGHGHLGWTLSAATAASVTNMISHCYPAK